MRNVPEAEFRAAQVLLQLADENRDGIRLEIAGKPNVLQPGLNARRNDKVLGKREIKARVDVQRPNQRLEHVCNGLGRIAEPQPELALLDGVFALFSKVRNRVSERHRGMENQLLDAHRNCHDGQKLVRDKVGAVFGNLLWPQVRVLVVDVARGREAQN
jgi:hypothetical protein